MNPYSSADSADERFSTPRARARGGGYLSSGDEGFMTPRRFPPNSARTVYSSDEPESARSGRYRTPRGFSSEERDDMWDDGFYTSRRQGGPPTYPLAASAKTKGEASFYSAPFDYESKIADFTAPRSSQHACGSNLPPRASPPLHRQSHYVSPKSESLGNSIGAMASPTSRPQYYNYEQLSSYHAPIEQQKHRYVEQEFGAMGLVSAHSAHLASWEGNGQHGNYQGSRPQKRGGNSWGHFRYISR